MRLGDIIIDWSGANKYLIQRHTLKIIGKAVAEITIDQVLQQGIQAHEAGQVQDAARNYAAILKAQPKHPDANHNMGVLFVGVEKVREALPLFKTALEVNPSKAQFWISYIDTLIRLDRLTDAKIALDQAKNRGATGDRFDQLGQRIKEALGEQLEISKKSLGDTNWEPNILDSLNLEQAIRLAKKKFKSGSLKEARRIYQDILAKFPQNKRARDGIKALVGGSTGNTSKDQDPPQDQLQALIALYDQGLFELALEQTEELILQFPASSILYNLKGVLLKGMGQLDLSIQAYIKALTIRPTYAETHFNMGNALKEQGKLEESVSAYIKAMTIKPNYVEAYFNMGNALKEQGELEESIVAYNKALSIDPDYADVYFNMGNALKEQEKLDEAIKAYEKALEISPDHAEACLNMGSAFMGQGKPEPALEAYRKALAIKPDCSESYNNIGNILKDEGKLEKAIEAYKEALVIKPDDAEVHQNLSFTLLNVGKVQEGLAEYEWRWKTANALSHRRYFSKPQWDGQKNLQEKRLLLWCEQGVGDSINWSSRLPLISTRVQHCILECPGKLVPLLTRSFPNIEVKPEDRSQDRYRSDFDYHLPLGSLYKNFISEICQNSRPNAFLVPDPIRVKFWRKRLRSLGNGPYIGVSWKSANMSLKRLPNYAHLSEWSPIFKLPNVTFVNLQYVDFLNDLNSILRDLGVTIHNFDDLDHYDDIADVAALCAALDMVVSTKITVPLISAGVGTLTKLAAWRQSPWNNILLNPVGPSVDIFARNTWEPWHKVFSRIAQDIVKLQFEMDSTTRSF